MKQKLIAFWQLYKCKSFHLVTTEEIMTENATTVHSNMSQEEFDKYMGDLTHGIAKAILEIRKMNEAK